MRRTPFLRKSYTWKRKPVLRRIRLGTHARSTTDIPKDIRGRRLLGVGRRTREWRAAWRFLKPRLEAAGRVWCEFSFIPHVCSGPLDPAHSRKRNKITGDQIYEVAIACRRIHDHLDLDLSHEQMEQAVLKAIELHGGMILPERKVA